MQEEIPVLKTPELPERGIAEYVAKEIEMKTITAITFNDLEVVIFYLYRSGLLILRYRSALIDDSVLMDAVNAKVSIHAIKRHA